MACADEHEEVDPEPGRKGVVFVHGLASCALQGSKRRGDFIKLTDYLVHCNQCRDPDEEGTAKLLYVSIKEYTARPQVLQCLALTLAEATSEEGVPTVETSSCFEELHTGPVKGIRGIRTLNPGGATAIPLWKNLIDTVKGDTNMFAFNYDWRRWGDLLYTKEVVDEFKECIEDAMEVCEQPVSLIGHSMGAQVILYCLGVLGNKWQQQFVEQIILVGPAPMGSASMFAAYACGPSAVAHSTVVPVVELLEFKLGQITSSWPAMVAMLPIQVGPTQPFEPAKVIAKTPTKTYTVSNVQEFLDDLAECTKGQKVDPLYSAYASYRSAMEEWGVFNKELTWTPGYQYASRMYEGIASMGPCMTAPAVKTHIIYNKSIDTISCMEFRSDDLRRQPKYTEYEGGDDTISAASIEAMSSRWEALGTKVELHLSPAHIHHKELISDKSSTDLIAKLLGIRDSDSEDDEEDDEEDNEEHQTGFC